MYVVELISLMVSCFQGCSWHLYLSNSFIQTSMFLLSVAHLAWLASWRFSKGGQFCTEDDKPFFSFGQFFTIGWFIGQLALNICIWCFSCGTIAAWYYCLDTGKFWSQDPKSWFNKNRCVKFHKKVHSQHSEVQTHENV